jgi:predicted RNA-binding protein with PIN domain
MAEVIAWWKIALGWRAAIIMALVRILVDGYSLLHSWPELARGHARHSATARDELVNILRRYSDAVQTPITVVFDGGGHRGTRQEMQSTTQVEILYSRAGQTADQIIERVTHRMKPYGEVLVVTNDHAERDTVIAMGGFAASCESFIETMDGALRDLEREVQHYNSAEKRRYKRS